MNDRLIAFSLLAATASALPIASQEPPAGQFEERLEVTEVLLDVLVTDARGNVVIGLGPSDFVVEEDGEPVTLTGAAFYSNRRFVDSEEMASRMGVDKSVVPSDRYFVLFFQDDRSADPSLATFYLDAARSTREWLGTLLVNDYVAVVSYDSTLKIWSDFTADKAVAARAVDGIFGQGGRALTTWPSRQPSVDRPTLLGNLPQGRELRRRTRKIYDGLQLIAEAMDGITGRKNLILYSIGFGEAREFGVWSPDPRYYPGMVQALNDRNVAAYAIDLISTEKQGSVQDRGINQALSQLADDTGGRYYFSFADFRSPLAQVAEEASGYYLLSYRAHHPVGEAGYQRVEVRAVNPAFEVKARQGYRYGTQG